jgi:hypothetical protein
MKTYLHRCASSFGAKSTVLCALLLGLPGAPMAYAAGQPAPGNKDQLVSRVIELIKPEAVPLQRLEAIVVNAVQQAKIGMESRVAPDKRDAAMREIVAISKKTLEETEPIVRSAGEKLAPTTVGQLLRDKFSEDELRQLIALLESPVRKKFDEVLPQLQLSIGKAVFDETRPQVDPKLKAMGDAISQRIGEAVKGH